MGEGFTVAALFDALHEHAAADHIIREVWEGETEGDRDPLPWANGHGAVLLIAEPGAAGSVRPGSSMASSQTMPANMACSSSVHDGPVPCRSHQAMVSLRAWAALVEPAGSSIVPMRALR